MLQYTQCNYCYNAALLENVKHQWLTVKKKTHTHRNRRGEETVWRGRRWMERLRHRQMRLIVLEAQLSGFQGLDARVQNDFNHRWVKLVKTGRLFIQHSSIEGNSAMKGPWREEPGSSLASSCDLRSFLFPSFLHMFHECRFYWKEYIYFKDVWYLLTSVLCVILMTN